MPKVRRARIFEKENGVCYLCGLKVGADELWDAEHVKAWELFHDDSDENLRVAHREGCHKAKTAQDVKIIRKSDRQAGTKGQWARRQNRGHSLIQNRGFEKPIIKKQWPSRPFNNKGDKK